MKSFDGILTGLSQRERAAEDPLLFEIQIELGQQLVVLASQLFYFKDEDMGRLLKEAVTDCLNNHLYYEA